MVKIINSNGTVSIASEVFTNIVGDAATRCFGVKGMVALQKENGLYQLLRRESMGKGVSVSFGEDDTVSVALHIAVDQGVNLAQEIRDNTARALGLSGSAEAEALLARKYGKA